jgi:hypothetical protein
MTADSGGLRAGHRRHAHAASSSMLRWPRAPVRTTESARRHDMTDDAVLDETRQPPAGSCSRYWARPDHRRGGSRSQRHRYLFAGRCAVRIRPGLDASVQLSVDGGDPGDQRADRPRHRLWHRRQSAPALSDVAVGQHRPIAVNRQPDQPRRRSRCDGRGAEAADRRSRPALCRTVSTLSVGLQLFTRYARYVSILSRQSRNQTG